MAARFVSGLVLSAALAAYMLPALAQSRIPGAPSNAPPRVTDVTSRAEGIADRVQTVFENVDMLASYLRAEKIASRLGDYLSQIGAKPTSGEVHIFYVQALMDGNGSVDLKDFQYLTNGKTAEDALRESFAVEHAPGTEDRLNAKPNGTRLVGIYVTATPEDGKFAISGGTLSEDHYRTLREQGLALRAKRAEDDRIAAIRQQRAATHRAYDLQALAQWQRAMARGPLPPGPALFPPGPPPDRAPPVYRPATRAGVQPNHPPMQMPPPAAHPAVPFNQPTPQTPPPNEGVELRRL